MRVLIFGDSITQGFWDSQGGWVQRLIDSYFQQQIKDLNADMPMLFNLGISADTMDNLLQRFEAETKARLRPEEMTLVFAIGTNDSQVVGEKPLYTPEQYAANLEILLNKARQFTDEGHIMFVGLQACDEARTTPVSWRDVSYTNERLQQFDKVLQQLCAKHSVTYVPVFESFQKGRTRQELLLDGLHPNDAGHHIIYEQVAPQLAKLLAV